MLKQNEKLKLDDSVARCEQDHICFKTKSIFLRRDENLCNKSEETYDCKLPFPITTIEKNCLKSYFPVVNVGILIICLYWTVLNNFL